MASGGGGTIPGAFAGSEQPPEGLQPIGGGPGGGQQETLRPDTEYRVPGTDLVLVTDDRGQVKTVRVGATEAAALNLPPIPGNVKALGLQMLVMALDALVEYVRGLQREAGGQTATIGLDSVPPWLRAALLQLLMQLLQKGVGG